MKKTALQLLLLIAMMVLMPVYTVHAIGFGVSPIRFEEELEPGQSVERTLKITNNGPAVNAEFIAQDFMAKDETGSPQMLNEGELHPTYSLAKWVVLPQDTFFEVNETKEVTFTIKVPENAEPGGHYGAVLVQQKAQESQAVATVSRIGAIVLLRVKGEAREAASLESFTIPPEEVTDEAVVLETRLKNTGNVHLQPKGKIYIFDEEGKKLPAIGRKAVIDGRGVVLRTEDVDYVPFNKKDLSVLPDQTRKFETKWDRGPRKGKFMAQIEIQYGSGNEPLISEKTAFEIREGIEGSLSLADDGGLFFVETPLTFKAIIKNTGNVRLTPKAEVKLYNYFGAEKGSIPVTLSKEILMAGDEDTIDVNWDGDVFGPYTAKLIVQYGPEEAREEFSTETSFTVATTGKLIGIMSAILLILALIFYLISKFMSMRRQLKKMNNK